MKIGIAIAILLFATPAQACIVPTPLKIDEALRTATVVFRGHLVNYVPGVRREPATITFKVTEKLRGRLPDQVVVSWIAGVFTTPPQWVRSKDVIVAAVAETAKDGGPGLRVIHDGCSAAFMLSDTERNRTMIYNQVGK
jgi:hypothetical protein